MRLSADLVVIGAGPAGANAALAAAEHGLRVVMVDEGSSPGGQIWRAPRTAAAHSKLPDADRREGDALRQRVAASAVMVVKGVLVWSVTPGFRVDAAGEGGPLRIEAPRLVVAAGATERVVPFPGWTTPGVLGLAAATALIKAEGTLPGKRIVVAGQGPLLMAVAAKAVRMGKRLVAVVDTNGPTDWARALGGFVAAPALAMRGLSWAATLAGRRVPVLFRHAVVGAGGGERLAEVQVAPLDRGGRPDLSKTRVIEADVLYVGNGLIPNTEVTRLLGAEHEHDPLCGGLVPVTDGFGRTSVPGLYAAGDGAGIRGARLAEAGGRLAGFAAAADAGALPSPSLTLTAVPNRASLRRLARFADASCRLMRPDPERIRAITPETIICRCEDVSRRAIDAAVAAGATDLNQLKHFTRAGMGPCQGRMCAENVADIVGLHVGERPRAGCFTPRTPLRPVATADLCGTFDYDDIPVPTPAPL